jgi:hypothetical protein
MGVSQPTEPFARVSVTFPRKGQEPCAAALDPARGGERLSFVGFVWRGSTSRSQEGLAIFEIEGIGRLVLMDKVPSSESNRNAST